MKKSLTEGEWPSSFQLGFRLTEFAGFNVDKCMPMSSKMVPLWLNCVEYHGDDHPSTLPEGAIDLPGGEDEEESLSSTVLVAPINPPSRILLFKRGDDLRQDQLTVQFLRFVCGTHCSSTLCRFASREWTLELLPLCLTTWQLAW